MTASDIVAVVQAFGLECVSGPLGIVVGHPALEQVRLETTRGDDWRLMENTPLRPFAHVHTAHIRRPAQLNRALREWMAGPRPALIPTGHEVYACLNGVDYVWNMRRKRSGGGA